MTRLYAATGEGIARLDEDGGRWTARVGLGGTPAYALAVDPRDADVVYAATRGQGLWRSRDGGAAWEDMQLPEADVFSVAVSAADGTVYAGCEPSMLFRRENGGWRELSALRDLPSAPTWSFPPRPWTSHVRWIAPSPHDAGLLLVGIELGGLMRSLDGGETWQDHRPGAQRDVHSLAWHARERGRAYEAAGGGAAWSRDAGATWESADEGRDRHYTWAVAADPDDPEVWFVSASTGPRAAHAGPRAHAEARLYRRDGSAPWQPLAGGLPDPSESMLYGLAAADGRLFAGLADGRLYVGDARGEAWQPLRVEADGLSAVHALAAVA